MVGETLQFARDEATTEPRRPTDIAALVQSIVDDMADAGLPVKMQPAQPIVYDCRPDRLEARVPQPARQCGQVWQGSERGDPNDAENDRDHH